MLTPNAPMELGVNTAVLNSLARVSELTSAPGQFGILLAGSRKKGHEIEDGIYVVVLDSLTESIEVKSIQLDCPGVCSDLGDSLVFKVCTDYIVFPIMFLEVGYQFGADLSAGAYN